MSTKNLHELTDEEIAKERVRLKAVIDHCADESMIINEKQKSAIAELRPIAEEEIRRTAAKTKGMKAGELISFYKARSELYKRVK